MSGTTPIEVRSVRFRYLTDPVLRGIDMTVREGEMVGLIGPNGSGKTTILKLLSRVLLPESGTISLFGTEITALSNRSVAEFMAVVPQELSVSFPFRAFEVVLMGRAPFMGRAAFESTSDIEIARQAMRMTDTEPFENRAVNELSGGERQRVIIAKALAQEPRILLLDEPTSFLDLRHELEIYEILRKLNAERRLTILLVSHDLNLASQYCDRLVLLKEGQIFAEGTPAEVLVENTLRAVYEVDVTVHINENTGRPFVLPRRLTRPHGAHKVE